MSGNPTPLMKIGQNLLCTGSSTQGTTSPKQFTMTTPGPHASKIIGHLGPCINTHKIHQLYYHLQFLIHVIQKSLPKPQPGFLLNTASSERRPLPVPEIVIPRQGEQSPVVIISYMGYSPPKCTCHDKQSHSSKYIILLECLHAQSHVPSPHRLPHTCLSQM